MLTFRQHPALTLQSMESRIQRSSLHLKHISGSQTQSLDNAISMLRSPLQRLKNKHVECSLQQLNPVLIMVFLVHRCRHSTPNGGRLSTWALYSAASSPAHSADLKVRQFSGRKLVILHGAK